MITPRISLIAIQDQDENKVFVKVPTEPGRWILAQKCVVVVACPLCKASVGEPCFNPDNGKYWTETHHVRRLAYQRSKK